MKIKEKRNPLLFLCVLNERIKVKKGTVSSERFVFAENCINVGQLNDEELPLNAMRFVRVWFEMKSALVSFVFFYAFYYICVKQARSH